MAWHRSRPTAVDSDASPPAAAHNGMMLLIFSAGLIWRFRIVSTVTILQHAICSRISSERQYRRRGASTGKAEETPREIPGLRPAEELGKRWRFFPTYAGVQTSPLLRQPFLRDPCDPECWIRRLPACVPAKRRSRHALGRVPQGKRAAHAGPGAALHSYALTPSICLIEIPIKAKTVPMINATETHEMVL